MPTDEERRRWRELGAMAAAFVREYQHYLGGCLKRGEPMLTLREWLGPPEAEEPVYQCETCHDEGKVITGADKFANVAFLEPCPDCSKDVLPDAPKQALAIIGGHSYGGPSALDLEWRVFEEAIAPYRVDLETAKQYRLSPPHMWSSEGPPL